MQHDTRYKTTNRSTDLIKEKTPKKTDFSQKSRLLSRECELSLSRDSNVQTYPIANMGNLMYFQEIQVLLYLERFGS
jgi:hypothetical protein